MWNGELVHQVEIKEYSQDNFQGGAVSKFSVIEFVTENVETYKNI